MKELCDMREGEGQVLGGLSQNGLSSTVLFGKRLPEQPCFAARCCRQAFAEHAGNIRGLQRANLGVYRPTGASVFNKCP